MKKVFSAILLVLLLAFNSVNANATVVDWKDFTNAELSTMKELFDDPSGSAKILVWDVPAGGELMVEFKAWDSSNFSVIGIGNQKKYYDFTAYDGMRLDFYNSTIENNADMWANLFMVTKVGSVNKFYQSEWVKLPYEALTTISMDFSSVTGFLGNNDNASPLGVGAIPIADLDNVWRYGFLIGNTKDNDAKNYIHAAVAPVPEPGTLLLLGSGLAGLAAAKRRKKS